MCVFWDLCAYHFFFFLGWENVFESLKYCLDHWLSCMFNCIHVCVFLFLKKLFLSNLDNSSTPSLSIELFSFFLSQSRHLLIARLIDWATFYPLDSSSTDPQSIELLFALDTCSIAASVEPFKARHLSVCWELRSLYIKGSRDLRLISLNLSQSLLTLHLPKPLSLTPNLFLKDFSA